MIGKAHKTAGSESFNSKHITILYGYDKMSAPQERGTVYPCCSWRLQYRRQFCFVLSCRRSCPSLFGEFGNSR